MVLTASGLRGASSMCSCRQLLSFITFGRFDSVEWWGARLQHRLFSSTAPADASHRYDDSSSHDEKQKKLKSSEASGSTACEEDDGDEVQPETTTSVGNDPAVPGVETTGFVTLAARPSRPGAGRGKPPGHR